MDDFGKFVYLDVQKTGSTFVSAFLEKHSNQPRVKFEKHAKLEGDIDPATIHFISVRHPFEQYRSLFQYGCDGRGGLFTAIKRKGMEGMYENTPISFQKWMEFVLDPENAALLRPRFGRINTEIVGFQTYRFLYLGIRKPFRKMKRVKSLKQLETMHSRAKIYDFVLRNETLNEDLLTLIEDHLSEFFDDLDAVRADLQQEMRSVNASSKQAITEDDLDNDLRDLLRRREHVLYESFYPES